MADYLILNQRRYEGMMILFLLIASCTLIRDCSCQPHRGKHLNISYKAVDDESELDSRSTEESFESKESSEEVILYTDFGPLYVLDNGTGPLPYPFNETKSVIPHSSKRTVGTLALVVLGGVFILPILMGCYKVFRRFNTVSESCFKGRDDMQTWVEDQQIERLTRQDRESRPPAAPDLPPNEQLRYTPSLNDSHTRCVSPSTSTPFRVQFRGRQLSEAEYEMVTILIRNQQDENSSMPIDGTLPSPSVSPATVPQPPSYEQATQPCSDTSTSHERNVAQSPPPYAKNNTIPSNDPNNPQNELTCLNQDDPPPYMESETLLPQSQSTRS